MITTRRRGPLGTHNAVRLCLRLVGCLAALVLAMPVSEGLHAQGMLPEAHLDARSIRMIYRVRPELADELERTLRDASFNKRKEIMNKAIRRLDGETKVLENLPKNLRPADSARRKAAIDEAGSAVRTMLRYHESYARDTPLPESLIFSEYTLRFHADEDEIINGANFKDYKELYDFLRETYPADNGGRFLSDLIRLRNTDRIEFLEALHGVVDDLKAYRNRGKELSPCKQICGHAAQSPQSRAWCEAHCSD